MITRVQQFIMTTVYFATGTVKKKLDWKRFSVKSAEWDVSQHVLAVEVVDDQVIPVRFRVYFKGFYKTVLLGKFRLCEDPGYGPGLEDEVYVSEAVIDTDTYQALAGYLQESVLDPSEYQYYNLLLDTTGAPILDTNNHFILFV